MNYRLSKIINAEEGLGEGQDGEDLSERDNKIYLMECDVKK